MSERHLLDENVPATVEILEPQPDLGTEARRGRSPRTPLLALSGVALVIAALAAVVLAIAVAAYLLA